MQFSSCDLSFSAGKRVILHPINLSILKGKVYGLIGHNGSGKSTLLKILARQHAPSHGTVQCEGADLQAWGGRQFARKVAYLPQDLPPVPGLTVRDLVAHGRYPWHGAFGRLRPKDHDMIAHAMAQTGVASLENRLVDTLSGGERQRVWIAMLIAQNPTCLLLDEPISALDIGHQQDILELICQLSQQQNLTVVMVLHDINMAARYCAHLLALKDGQLLADGAPDTVLVPDMLRTLFGVKMQVVPHPGGEGSVAILD
jgi:iron complex transport system ATP-binding protein